MALERMRDLLLSVVEHRICDHYLPKLCAALDCVDAGMLWDESDPNAVGAIVLHMVAHLRGVTNLLSKGNTALEPLEEVFPVTGQAPADLAADLSAAGGEFRAAISECRHGQTQLIDVTVQRLLHLMEPVGYHTGQVVYATRFKTGRESGLRRWSRKTASDASDSASSVVRGAGRKATRSVRAARPAPP